MSMVEARKAESGFLETLLAPAANAAPRGDQWLRTRRSNALELASSLSVPTTRDEDWRFTDLTTLYRLKVKPAEKGGQVDAAVLKTLLFPEATTRLVFVDGHFDDAASHIAHDGKIRVGSLSLQFPYPQLLAR